MPRPTAGSFRVARAIWDRTFVQLTGDRALSILGRESQSRRKITNIWLVLEEVAGDTYCVGEGPVRHTQYVPCVRAAGITR